MLLLLVPFQPQPAPPVMPTDAISSDLIGSNTTIVSQFKT